MNRDQFAWLSEAILLLIMQAIYPDLKPVNQKRLNRLETERARILKDLETKETRNDNH